LVAYQETTFSTTRMVRQLEKERVAVSYSIQNTTGTTNLGKRANHSCHEAPCHLCLKNMSRHKGVELLNCWLKQNTQMLHPDIPCLSLQNGFSKI